MDKLFSRKDKSTDRAKNSGNRDAYFNEKYANRTKSAIYKKYVYLDQYKSFSQIFAGVEPNELKGKINPQKSEFYTIIDTIENHLSKIDDTNKKYDIREELDFHIASTRDYFEDAFRKINKINRNKLSKKQFELIIAPYKQAIKKLGEEAKNCGIETNINIKFNSNLETIPEENEE